MKTLISLFAFVAISLQKAFSRTLQIHFTGILGLLMLLGSTTVQATSYYTRVTNGVWTNNIWGTTTTGTGGALPTLVDGDILYIDDPTTITTNVSISADITIVISATLTIDGQLNVGSGSVFQFTSSSGKIIATPPGNSDKIFIGTGPAEWSGNNGTITGPGSFQDGWTCCTLPITLISFDAHQEDEKVELKWATSHEKNFLGFSIERSGDGINYQEIGFVNGSTQDKTNIISTYGHVDQLPLAGRNYYRLKSFDLDESFEYSKVVFANAGAQLKLLAYPNPAHEKVHISTNFERSELDRIMLIDQLGRVMVEMPATHVGVEFDLQINYPAGVYFLKYLTANSSFTTRIVVATK